MTPQERRWWCLLDAVPTTLGTVHAWTGGALRWPFPDDGEFHANPTSVVCLQGVLRISRGTEHLDLAAGDALVIAPGVWHVHQPCRPGTVFFGQGFLPAWSDVMLGDDQRIWWGRLPSRPSRHLMEATLTAAEPDRRAAFVQLMEQVLSETILDFTFDQPAVRRMVERLWSGIHLGVTVDDLVRVSGLSRAQAYRLFRAGYGLPPKEAIAFTRQWLAQGLIDGGATPAEAARQSGYASASTFRRARQRDR